MLKFILVNKDGDKEPTCQYVSKEYNDMLFAFNVWVRKIKALGLSVSEKIQFRDNSRIFINSRLYDGDVLAVDYENSDGEPSVIAIKVCYEDNVE